MASPSPRGPDLEVLRLRDQHHRLETPRVTVDSAVIELDGKRRIELRGIDGSLLSGAHLMVVRDREAQRGLRGQLQLGRVHRATATTIVLSSPLVAPMRSCRRNLTISVRSKSGEVTL